MDFEVTEYDLSGSEEFIGEFDTSGENVEKRATINIQTEKGDLVISNDGTCVEVAQRPRTQSCRRSCRSDCRCVGPSWGASPPAMPDVPEKSVEDNLVPFGARNILDNNVRPS